jgi:hypothetical protein
MEKKNFRSTARWFGKRLSNPTALGIVGAIMAFLKGFVDEFYVYNPLLFAISILLCAFAGVVVSKLTSNMMFWISKQIDCIELQKKYETHQLLYLNVKNGYDQDINGFKVSLKNLSMLNFPVPFDIPQEGSEFNVIKGLDGKRLIARDNAKIYIAQIPSGDENYIYTELLIKDGWLNDAMFKLQNGVDDKIDMRVAIYDIILEISGKVEDELISRWYQARIQYTLSEKWNGSNTPERYVTLDWKNLEKYSKREFEKVAENIIDSKVILTAKSHQKGRN